MGALLHLLIPLGGPAWYAFFGAPSPLVAMAAQGALYPIVMCLAIASLLLVFAAYAFSGAGVIRPLPLRRTVLALIGVVLTLRGLAFVPLALWAPEALLRICDCQGVDTFLVLTSLVCLAMGLAYALGAFVCKAPA